MEASTVNQENLNASEANGNEGRGFEPGAKPIDDLIEEDDISADEKAELAWLTKLLEDSNASRGKVWVKTDAALLRKLLVLDPKASQGNASVKPDASKTSMEGGGLEPASKLMVGAKHIPSSPLMERGPGEYPPPCIDEAAMLEAEERGRKFMERILAGTDINGKPWGKRSIPPPHPVEYAEVYTSPEQTEKRLKAVQKFLDDVMASEGFDFWVQRGLEPTSKDALIANEISAWREEKERHNIKVHGCDEEMAILGILMKDINRPVYVPSENSPSW
ncbi:hypothetical protein LINGRAHAP2_LOCUS21384 [Linum grandiflorum]